MAIPTKGASPGKGAYFRPHQTWYRVGYDGAAPSRPTMSEVREDINLEEAFGCGAIARKVSRCGCRSKVWQSVRPAKETQGRLGPAGARMAHITACELGSVQLILILR